MTDNLTVTCPACGSPMTERLNRETMTTFLGCVTWPACRETQPVPAFVEVMRAGGTLLPGFGSPDEGERRKTITPQRADFGDSGGLGGVFTRKVPPGSSGSVCGPQNAAGTAGVRPRGGENGCASVVG